MLKHKQKWNLPLYHLLLYHWMKKLVVNDLLLSGGHYKLMKKSNVASAVAKGIFHPLFLDWIVLPGHQVSKKLATKKKYLLKQRDAPGRTLNYEGITALNDVETAAEFLQNAIRMGRLLPSPAFLTTCSPKVRKKGWTSWPISADKCGLWWRRGIWLHQNNMPSVIDAFGLGDIGKERWINISTSIDVTKLTKNITHTSSGLKMTDVQGRDSFRNKRSFIYEKNSLCNLQSCNANFSMKIIIMKETKESFKQFEDVYQFFHLFSETSEACHHEPSNLEKFQREESTTSWCNNYWYGSWLEAYCGWWQC
jgi:hypothetical protein